jgi:hypothetical protein
MPMFYLNCDGYVVFGNPEDDKIKSVRDERNRKMISFDIYEWTCFVDSPTYEGSFFNNMIQRALKKCTLPVFFKAVGDAMSLPVMFHFAFCVPNILCDHSQVIFDVVLQNVIPEFYLRDGQDSLIQLVTELEEKNFISIDNKYLIPDSRNMFYDMFIDYIFKKWPNQQLLTYEEPKLKDVRNTPKLGSKTVRESPRRRRVPRPRTRAREYNHNIKDDLTRLGW